MGGGEKHKGWTKPGTPRLKDGNPGEPAQEEKGRKAQLAKESPAKCFAEGWILGQEESHAEQSTNLMGGHPNSSQILAPSIFACMTEPSVNEFSA